jgi:hypothetical protein
MTENDPHQAIESAFYEFSKMKSFLENGVTKRVGNLPIVPINAAQAYVHSLLLVDLFSVFDQAYTHFFKHFKLKQQKGKSKLKILEEEGYITNPRYLEWYRSWRNGTAHAFERIEHHKLNQATKDVGIQLSEWGLMSPRLRYWPYEVNVTDSHCKVGSRIYGKSIKEDIIVLEFEVWSDRPNAGSSKKTLDLSWSDFVGTYPDILNNLK